MGRPADAMPVGVTPSPTRHGRARGQSTIELVLTLFAFFTIFFMFVQMSLSFAVANYIQYATFMASRALLSAHKTLEDQKTAATDYLTKMLGAGGGRFRSIASPDGDGDFPGAKVGPSTRSHLAPAQDARDTSWEQGVTYGFKVKMYLAPMVPGVGRGDSSKVQLQSQSWLGREPSESECDSQMSQRIRREVPNNSFSIYDNGC